MAISIATAIESVKRYVPDEESTFGAAAGGEIKFVANLDNGAFLAVGTATQDVFFNDRVRRLRSTNDGVTWAFVFDGIDEHPIFNFSFFRVGHGRQPIVTEPGVVRIGTTFAGGVAGPDPGDADGVLLRIEDGVELFRDTIGGPPGDPANGWWEIDNFNYNVHQIASFNGTRKVASGLFTTSPSYPNAHLYYATDFDGPWGPEGNDATGTIRFTAEPNTTINTMTSVAHVRDNIVLAGGQIARSSGAPSGRLYVFRSAANGDDTTWVARTLESDADLDGGVVRDILVLPSGTILVAGDVTYTGKLSTARLWRSTDEGVTFIDITSALPDVPTEGATNPGDPANPQIYDFTRAVYLTLTSDGRVVLGLNGRPENLGHVNELNVLVDASQWRISDDDGVTWQTIQATYPSDINATELIQIQGQCATATGGILATTIRVANNWTPTNTAVSDIWRWGDAATGTASPPVPTACVPTLTPEPCAPECPPEPSSQGAQSTAAFTDAAFLSPLFILGLAVGTSRTGTLTRPSVCGATLTGNIACPQEVA